MHVKYCGLCQSDLSMVSGELDLESMITARPPLEEVNEGFADLQASRGIRR